MPVGTKESNETGLLAVIKALQLSSTREKFMGKSVIIESDSANAINWMSNESSRRWKLHQLFILASRFSLVLGFVKYRMAYALAEQGVDRDSELMAWLSQLTRPGIKIIECVVFDID
ncbi:hypothetical protein SADUNF_Sadunf02G0122400 [Salix dunnii]|uniref:RNase H type-1 domain-containing protein n=1 Tax=Salix dunnii TaxID=1413687 RepID=A0A835TH16_9ROSI|nr:hypothetical protein SADUNF_Sadunf02G0122400 [Salix dunnii]